MNAQGLVDWGRARLGQGYIYGAYFDRLITEKYIQEKAKQYPSQFTEGYIQRSRKWIGKEAGDCVGLIKSFYWYDGNKVVYKYQGRADVSANGMHSMSTYKGLMSTMPDRAGIYVHKDGHIGIYIGNGQVIEAKGVDYGVIQSRLSDTKWTSWGEVPYIDYGGSKMDLEILKKISPIQQGQQVEVFQRLANVILSAKLEIDGQFGTRSEQAAKDIQKKLGLTVDGKVGANTWAKILPYIKKDQGDLEVLIMSLQADKLSLEQEISCKDKQYKEQVNACNKSIEQLEALIDDKDNEIEKLKETGAPDYTVGELLHMIIDKVFSK